MPLKTVNLLFLIFYFSFSTNAATITKIKNNKVLLDNDDAEIQIGQEFYIIDKNNKKTGSLVRIISVRGEKSVGLIFRGNILPNQTLLPKPPSSEQPVANLRETKEDETTDTDTSETDSDESPVTVFRNNTKKIGVLFDVLLNTMNAKESDGTPPTPNIETVTMVGTSIGLTGTVDYPVKPWLELRGTAGFEPFSVSGMAMITGCDNATSKNCSANINYLVAGGYSRFNLYQKKFINVWAGIGFNLRYPIAKSSTAVRSSDLNLTTSYGFAAGGEYFLTFKRFIPFSIEQQYFKSSDTVSANLLSFRAGYGISY